MKILLLVLYFYLIMLIQVAVAEQFLQMYEDYYSYQPEQLYYLYRSCPIYLPFDTYNDSRYYNYYTDYYYIPGYYGWNKNK